MNKNAKDKVFLALPPAKKRARLTAAMSEKEKECKDTRQVKNDAYLKRKVAEFTDTLKAQMSAKDAKANDNRAKRFKKITGEGLAAAAASPSDASPTRPLRKRNAKGSGK